MLGIAHHSPQVIDVYIDRYSYRPFVVDDALLKTDHWQEDIDRFANAASDGRERVLFVTSVKALQSIARHKSAWAFKVVVFDTVEALGDLPIGDRRDGAEHWLSIETFNELVATTPPGITLPSEPEPASPPETSEEPESPRPTLPPDVPQTDVIVEKPSKPKRKGPKKKKTTGPKSYELF